MNQSEYEPEIAISCTSNCVPAVHSVTVALCFVPVSDDLSTESRVASPQLDGNVTWYSDRRCGRGA